MRSLRQSAVPELLQAIAAEGLWLRRQNVLPDGNIIREHEEGAFRRAAFATFTYSSSSPS